MCLGIPMQVVEGGVEFALCRRRNGEEQTVDLRLIGCQPGGSWVLVHLDTAREVLDAESAARIEDALTALEVALAGGNTDHLFADLVAREPELPPHLNPTRSLH